MTPLDQLKALEPELKSRQLEANYHDLNTVGIKEETVQTLLSAIHSLSDYRTPTFEEKSAINSRVQKRYNELMAIGKHGHYETMFKIVHEERALAAAPTKDEQ